MSGKHEFIFCSPGKPGNYKKYEKAVERLGWTDWMYIGGPGFSKAQVPHGHKAVKEVIRRASKAKSLTLIMFSAGYGAAKVLLQAGLHPDYILCIDSIHDRDLSDWTPHASRLGERFHFIHTDIQPPYRSTTSVSVELAEHGDISTYHVQGGDAKAHSRALVAEGPKVLRNDVCQQALVRFGKSSPPWRDPALTLGERAVLFSVEEAKRGNLETQGHNAGPRIREYFRLASRQARNGRTPFKAGALAQGNWCVVGACYATQMSLLEGEKMPHEYPVSVIELRESAEAEGRFRPAGSGYVPHVGDLCLRERKGQWAGTGHVERVMKVNEETGEYHTIGANEGTGWRVEKERLVDVDGLQGFIEYPRKKQVESMYYWPSRIPHDFTRWKTAMQEVEDVVALWGDDESE